MIFPIEELINFTGNIYEITCAATRRAYQISMLRDEDNKDDESTDKAVSIAAKQLFTKEVQYRIEHNPQ